MSNNIQPVELRYLLNIFTEIHLIWIKEKLLKV